MRQFMVKHIRLKVLFVPFSLMGDIQLFQQLSQLGLIQRLCHKQFMRHIQFFKLERIQFFRLGRIQFWQLVFQLGLILKLCHRRLMGYIQFGIQFVNSQ
jgi:hypothetical protein